MKRGTWILTRVRLLGKFGLLARVLVETVGLTNKRKLRLLLDHWMNLGIR
jgi:hypothetical protein